MTPLFIPLKTAYFEQFKAGTKDTEYRMYWRSWNEKNCYAGRPVTLSKGYGKYERLSGVIESVTVCKDPQSLPGWSDCYGQSNHPAICIKIRLNRPAP
jgi:hypothetical protein